MVGTSSAAEQLEGGPFRIVHHPDDVETARASLAILETALEEFSTRLPPGEGLIHIVIAHDLTEFRRYASHFGSLQISGLARPAEGLIVVKGPRLRAAGDDYGGTLRHELAHILLYRNVDTALLPKWLNEGLCMSLANEHYWSSMYQMTEMFAGNRIIEYRYLDLTFLSPGSEMAFGDAYAQALSMTRTLRNRLGEETFWAVVLDVGDGTTFGRSLEMHADLTVTEFWEKYRRSLWKTAVIGSIATGSLFGPASLLVIVAYFRKRRGNKKVLDRWEAEERRGRAGYDADWEDTLDFWDEVIEDPEAWEADSYWR